MLGRQSCAILTFLGAIHWYSIKSRGNGRLKVFMNIFNEGLWRKIEYLWWLCTHYILATVIVVHIANVYDFIYLKSNRTSHEWQETGCALHFLVQPHLLHHTMSVHSIDQKKTKALWEFYVYEQHRQVTHISLVEINYTIKLLHRSPSTNESTLVQASYDRSVAIPSWGLCMALPPCGNLVAEPPWVKTTLDIPQLLPRSKQTTS